MCFIGTVISQLALRSDSQIVGFMTRRSTSFPLLFVLESVRDVRIRAINKEYNQGWQSPVTIVSVSKLYNLSAITLQEMKNINETTGSLIIHLVKI